VPKRVIKKLRKINEALLLTLRTKLAKIRNSFDERESSFIQRRGKLDVKF
jgi:hypothetical protein